MAVLQHATSGVRYPLASRMLVGRSHACGVQLSSQQVSGVHAELAWDGERWFVHDLGSRNGTLLDGQRLSPEQRQPLSVGSQIAFGIDTEQFVLIDASPPGLVAMADGGRLVHATGGLLSLPSEDEPEVTLLAQLDGRWLVETEQGIRPLVHHEQITAGGVDWRVHLPGAVQYTADADADEPMSIATVRLEFTVSLDEEHVEIRVGHGPRDTPLRPRAHDFFLLTLARARLDDQAQPDLAEAEHGWVYRQDLARRLQVDRNLINLWIHRARRQFSDAGVLDVAGLIERRTGSEQLRLGVAQLRVTRQ